jgi:hypothetical protein
MTQQRPVRDARERDVDPSRRYDGAANFPVGVTKAVRRAAVGDGRMMRMLAISTPARQAPAFEIDRSRARDRAPNRPVKLRKKAKPNVPTAHHRAPESTHDCCFLHKTLMFSREAAALSF